MTLTAFILAVMALLVTPGPTNTLLALAGATEGARAVRLIPAELAGYLLTALPLALLGDALFAALPHARTGLVLGAAVWVGWLAVRLWRLPAAGGPAPVSFGRVFTTTLLNPKTLVFGLVLLPAAPGLAAAAGAFALCIVAAASGWVLLGMGIGLRAGGRGLYRAAACWLALLSLTLAAKGLGA